MAKKSEVTVTVSSSAKQPPSMEEIAQSIVANVLAEAAVEVPVAVSFECTGCKAGCVDGLHREGTIGNHLTWDKEANAWLCPETKEPAALAPKE